jgi:DNA-directed RNA polymerase subunit RPC12/RpoP
MKAINCTQCGAIIKRVLFNDRFAVCDYCEAKIVLAVDKEKSENTLQFAALEQSIYQPEQNNYFVRTIMFIVSLLILPIILFSIFSKNSSTDSANNTFATKPKPNYFSTPFPVQMPTVYPQIRYEVDVKWDGSNDMEHFQMPNIDSSKLKTSDTKELKKTVFANRSVQVRITIDENGEVSEAKAVSGHPILKEAAEDAARKTLFSNRRKPSKRLLTYIFRLVSE